MDEQLDAPSSSPILFVHCMVCQCKLDLQSPAGLALCSPPFEEHEDLRASGEHTPSASSSCAEEDVTELAELLDEQCHLSSATTTSPAINPGTSQSGNLLEMICQSSSPLQVPMCKRCSSQVSSELSKQLGDLEAECLNYRAALDQLIEKQADSPFDAQTAKRKLEQMRAEEGDLLEQLRALEAEECSLNERLAEKQEERKKVADKDEQLYRTLRDNHRILIEQAEEQRSLRAQIRYANEQVQRLSRTNVLDLAFHIWQSGDYGTINGLRLGRLRQEPVDWQEINAALGQIAALLDVLARKVQLRFGGWELFPCGSTSFIRVTSRAAGEEQLPLYGTGGWRPFGQPQLDQALVAYLDCFIQLEGRLRERFSAVQPSQQILPYRMIKDKIIDRDSQYLVKMQLNSEERWTRAMKCLLLNLKRAVGIVSNLKGDA